MTLNIPPQPTLPPEGAFNEIELSFIDEQPETFPTNQNSNWGFLRMVLCNQLQELADDIEIVYRNLFIDSADEHLDMWEEQHGLPVEPSGYSINARRAAVKSRMQKGAFTRERRRAIVESYVVATFGVPTSITITGIEITAGGITLYAEAVDFGLAYIITENVTNYEYTISISKDLGVDIAGMRRELERMTPAGITVTITEDFFETIGATSISTGGMTIDRSGL
jgi:uncharacterized protein YmfQ (DUF2313 family)